MPRVFLLVPLLLTNVACHRAVKHPLRAAVGMADPEVTNQLISGFYSLEENKWRWTAREFCITFPGATEKKIHTLTLQLFIPDTQIQKMGHVTLAADVNGSILEPETFHEGGMHTYRRVVPEPALETNIVPVVFFLDKAAPQAAGETRELGVVVTGAKLEAI